MQYISNSNDGNADDEIMEKRPSGGVSHRRRQGALRRGHLSQAKRKWSDCWLERPSPSAFARK